MELIGPSYAPFIFFFFTFITIFNMVVIVFALIDILKGNFRNNDKLVWVLVTIFVPLGGLLYFFIGRSQKIEE